MEERKSHANLAHGRSKCQHLYVTFAIKRVAKILGETASTDRYGLVY